MSFPGSSSLIPEISTEVCPTSPTAMVVAGDGLRQWTAYEFYLTERDFAITHFLWPAIASLHKEGLLCRCNFLRYSLPEPHLFFELELQPHSHDAADSLLRQAAADCLRQSQLAAVSRSPASREISQGTLRERPSRIDSKLYGGDAYVEYGRYFLSLASVQAVHFLSLEVTAQWSRRLTLVFRHLARQALGFAGGEDELVSLLAYVAEWKGNPGSILARADRTFDQRREAFSGLFQRELERARCSGSDWSTAEEALVNVAPARCLSNALQPCPSQARRDILCRQMHLTANRLGMRNADEVLLSRLLSRAANELRDHKPATWQLLASQPPAYGHGCWEPCSWESLLSVALASLSW
jgi:hypothetical protein